MLSRRDYARLLGPLLAPAAGYARSILRDRGDAEDAVQQAALRGLERLATFDTTRPFKGWWFAILRNCCIDALRARRTGQISSLEGYDPPAPSCSDREDWERLSTAMNRLKTDQRTILQLRYFAGLSYRELAEALAIPQGTVMSRLHLARKALARIAAEEAL